MIITVGGQKGGSGKSCLAQNLSVALVKKGHDVLLIDADPQQTSSDWADERSSTNAQQLDHQAMTGDISRTVVALAESGRVIVVDCGGRDTRELRSAMVVSDLVLIPTRPKRRDLKTLDYVADLVEKTRITNSALIARTVISQAPTLPSQIQRILDAKAVADSFGLPALNTVIFTRNVYDDAEESGLSVFEAEDEKAKTEISSVLSEVMDLIGGSNDHQ